MSALNLTTHNEISKSVLFHAAVLNTQYIYFIQKLSSGQKDNFDSLHDENLCNNCVDLRSFVSTDWFYASLISMVLYL